MIAIGRGQLHAPDRTITNEPDRVEEGRLSCAVRPEQDIHGLEGQRNISHRAIILDLYLLQAGWHDRRVSRKALSYSAPCWSMIHHVERFMNRAVSGVDAPPPYQGCLDSAIGGGWATSDLGTLAAESPGRSAAKVEDHTLVAIRGRREQ